MLMESAVWVGPCSLQESSGLEESLRTVKRLEMRRNVPTSFQQQVKITFPAE